VDGHRLEVVEGRPVQVDGHRRDAERVRDRVGDRLKGRLEVRTGPQGSRDGEQTIQG